MRRKLLMSGIVIVVLGGAIAGYVLASGSSAKKPAAGSGLPPATATVTRTTLVETKTVPGILGYGEPAPVGAVQRGIVTWMAPVGFVVARGRPLFKVDDRPVVALNGPLPLYRTLRAGAKGRDVHELERNLAALGYTDFTVDDTYTAATAVAVSAWHTDLGLPATGIVEVGQVVVAPRAVRIAGHAARVVDAVGGASAERGASVLSYTDTTRIVTVALEVPDRALAIKGRTVTVTVPGLRPLKAKVSDVGTVITAQGTSAAAGSAADGKSPAPADPRVDVTVTIADQKALGSLDAAPVDVDFVSDRRDDVLAVPVVALLALANGGFGVQVVDGETTRIVAVRTGMFAGGQVEISGNGIADGVKVGVPK